MSDSERTFIISSHGTPKEVVPNVEGPISMITRQSSRERLGLKPNGLGTQEPAFLIFNEGEEVPQKAACTKKRKGRRRPHHSGAPLKDGVNKENDTTSVFNVPALMRSRSRSGSGMREDDANGLYGSSSSSSSSSSSAALSSSLGLKKTIEISKKERQMNGAPEGELFDSTVVDDDDLLPCHAPLKELQRMVLSHQRSSVWADQFAAIEFFRRIALHHADVLVADPCLLGYVVEAGVEASRSIRSSTTRNGILCLRAVLRSCPDHAMAIYAEDIFSVLFHRIGAGPRFIADLADQVCTEGSARLSSGIVVTAIGPSTTHKNATASGKAVYLLAVRAQALALWSADLPQWMLAVPLLTEGLDSRRSSGKDASRTCLAQALGAVGATIFVDHLCAAGLSTSRAEAVRERVERGTGSGGCSSANKARRSRTAFAASLKAAKEAKSVKAGVRQEGQDHDRRQGGWTLNV